MDAQTVIVSIIGSGVIAAFVTGWMNHRSQIKAIKESGIYANRAKILDELMRRMERVTDEMTSIQFSLLKDAKVELTTNENVSNAYREFSDYFKENKHYLPKSLAVKITSLLAEFQHIHVSYQRDKHLDGVKLSYDDLNKKLIGIVEKLVDKKEDITDEFRKMIGVK